MNGYDTPGSCFVLGELAAIRMFLTPYWENVKFLTFILRHRASGSTVKRWMTISSRSPRAIWYDRTLLQSLFDSQQLSATMLLLSTFCLIFSVVILGCNVIGPGSGFRFGLINR
jgi:hypothetical protein